MLIVLNYWLCLWQVMVCAIRAKLLVVSMASDGVCADRAKLLVVSMASDGVCYSC